MIDPSTRPDRYVFSAESTPKDLFGYYKIIDGKQEFALSPLLYAYTNGRTITLVATDSLPADLAHMLAMLLDDKGPMVMPRGDALTRHPDFKVVLEA